MKENVSGCFFLNTVYNLRYRSTHNRQLPARTGHLTDGNFITRLLYKDCYWTFISMWLFTYCILLGVSLL